MIVTASNLRKSFGSTLAVDDVSFQLRPGQVTGFLGPNGSGKSTTMRLMLGLDHGPGTTLWDGKPLDSYPHAPDVVGAHLDAKDYHPNRTARNHLMMLAAASNTPKARVDEVIAFMGLDSVANKRPKGFSLGMAQRLGLAGAILAEPAVLMLDEPANGLDPQSIHWLRDYLKSYAAAGRSVFVSSHLLNEMEIMADHVIVIARGHTVADEPMAAFLSQAAASDVYVRTADPGSLSTAIAAELGPGRVRSDQGGLAISGVTTDQIGDIAFRNSIPLSELTARRASLEEAFLELTSDDQDFEVGRQS